MAVCQNLVPLVNIKIAGKWMFIPLKMVLIGFDPSPYSSILQSVAKHGVQIPWFLGCRKLLLSFSRRPSCTCQGETTTRGLIDNASDGSQMGLWPGIGATLEIAFVSFKWQT